MLPRPGEVHLLCFDLASSAVAAGETVLDAEERGRAAKARPGDQRRRFVIAHVLLRQALGAYLGLAPGDVELRFGERGKPCTAGIAFNLTHAGDLALAAFACDREVGIDLEERRPVADLETIVRHHFAPDEVDRVVTAPPHLRESLFYACWTRKEAVTKALGLGLAVPLDSFAVSLPGDEPARVRGASGAVATAETWSLTALAPRAGYCGALAVRGAPPRIVLWQERT